MTGSRMNFEKYRHYLRARMFVTLGRPARAIEEYRLTLRHDPGFVKAASCLAYLYASEQQFDQAERSYRELLQLCPDDAYEHFNHGYVCDKLGKRTEAIAAFSEAVKRKPALDRAWYGMGMAHAALGQHELAAKALEEAARLQPMNTHAWYALGMAYHRLNNPGKVQEIVLHLHRIGPLVCRQLIKEADRTDLAYLVKDMAV